MIYTYQGGIKWNEEEMKKVIEEASRFIEDEPYYQQFLPLKSN